MGSSARAASSAFLSGGECGQIRATKHVGLHSLPNRINLEVSMKNSRKLSSRRKRRTDEPVSEVDEPLFLARSEHV